MLCPGQAGLCGEGDSLGGEGPAAVTTSLCAPVSSTVSASGLYPVPAPGRNKEGDEKQGNHREACSAKAEGDSSTSTALSPPPGTAPTEPPATAPGSLEYLGCGG